MLMIKKLQMASPLWKSEPHFSPWIPQISLVIVAPPEVLSETPAAVVFLLPRECKHTQLVSRL